MIACASIGLESAAETLVMNMGLIRGPEKDSNSTLHSLVVQGGNSRDGEGLEDCALELDPRTSTDEGSLKELQVIDCLSGIESNGRLAKSA